MKKINTYLFQYLKWTVPLVILAVVLDLKKISDDGLFFDLIGWVTIFWFVVLIYFVFSILFQSQIRELVIRKFARIQENDEREVYITGLAAKKTFILSTALIILCFFLNSLTLEISRLKVNPNSKVKTGIVKIGLNLNVLQSNSDLDSKPIKNPDRYYYLLWQGLPMGLSDLMIIVLITQLGSFYLFSKQEKE